MDSFKSISITKIAQSAHFLFFLPGCGSRAAACHRILAGQPATHVTACAGAKQLVSLKWQVDRTQAFFAHTA
jgi:hypothetical protein